MSKVIEQMLNEVDILEVDSKKSAVLRTDLLSFRDVLEDSYLNFAEKLYEISRSSVDGKPVWKDWGFDTFEDFIKEELIMKKRKVFYMIGIWYELVVRLGLTREALHEIDWTKAREIAPLARVGILNAGNADEWMTKAKELSYPQLIEEVKVAKLYAESEELIEVETIHRHTFGLYGPQHDNLMEAFKRAEVISGSDKKGHLLDLLATEFNAANPSGVKTEEAAIGMIERVERTFGIKLIGINKKDAIIYGKEYTED